MVLDWSFFIWHNTPTSWLLGRHAVEIEPSLCTLLYCARYLDSISNLYIYVLGPLNDTTVWLCSSLLASFDRAPGAWADTANAEIEGCFSKPKSYRCADAQYQPVVGSGRT